MYCISILRFLVFVFVFVFVLIPTHNPFFHSVPAVLEPRVTPWAMRRIRQTRQGRTPAVCLFGGKQRMKQEIDEGFRVILYRRKQTESRDREKKKKKERRSLSVR